jgi:hypothetical protein
MKDLHIPSNTQGSQDDYFMSGALPTQTTSKMQYMHGFDEVVPPYTGNGKDKAADPATSTPIPDGVPNFDFNW